MVAAVAYEIYDVSLMCDYAFDIQCRYLPLPTSIEGFDPSTGQWAQEYKDNQEVIDKVEQIIEEVSQSRGKEMWVKQIFGWRLTI